MAVERIQGIGTFPMPAADGKGKQKPSSPPPESGARVDDVVTLSGMGGGPRRTPVAVVPVPRAMSQTAEDAPRIRSCQLRFVIHENPDRIVVEVLDAETGEEIRQIPPEEILRLAAQLELLRSK